eukprot:snap_masked-scaffold144_size312663-processed-gene-2.26 protein:Tk07285 transcript:snap_masked-scaffold144_size312663-processed-gene-2.26-mRNA-1 annotation:"zinc finger protein ozf-like"
MAASVPPAPFWGPTAEEAWVKNETAEGNGGPHGSLSELTRTLENLTRAELLSVLTPHFFDEVSFWDLIFWRATLGKPKDVCGYQVMLRDLETLMQNVEDFIQSIFKIDSGQHPSGKNKSMESVLKSWELLGILCEPQPREELDILRVRYPNLELVLPDEKLKYEHGMAKDIFGEDEEGRKGEVMDVPSPNLGLDDDIDVDMVGGDGNDQEEEKVDDPVETEQTTEKRSSCKKCFTEFDSRSQSRDHMEKCESVPKCGRCRSEFTGKTRKWFRNHVAKCSGKEKKEVRWKRTGPDELSCTVDSCESSFSTLSAIKEHLTQTHATCSKCGQDFVHKSQEWIVQHQEACVGKKQKKKPVYKKIGTKQFVCSFEGCSYNQVFKTTKAARFHFYTEHTTEEDQIYPCSFCDARFAFITARTRHINLKHIKKYKCDLCGRAFGEPNQLAKHQMTHSGEKPFSCETCGNRFSRKSNLDQHKQTVHGDFGQRDCYCEICGMPFASPNNIY